MSLTVLVADQHGCDDLIYNVSTPQLMEWAFWDLFRLRDNAGYYDWLLEAAPAELPDGWEYVNADMAADEEAKWLRGARQGNVKAMRSLLIARQYEDDEGFYTYDAIEPPAPGSMIYNFGRN